MRGLSLCGIVYVFGSRSIYMQNITPAVCLCILADDGTMFSSEKASTDM